MIEADEPVILMADDDEEDCLLARGALEASGVRAAFSSVEDGAKLMDYLLERAGPKAGALPHLILLDLNMPKKDGREMLLEIKADQTLQHIPIVILTTSQEERDIAFTMKAGANSFITKPPTFDKWIEIMKSLGERWLPG